MSKRGLEPVMISFRGYAPGSETAFTVETGEVSDEADLVVLHGEGLGETTGGLVLGDELPGPGARVIVMGYPTGLRALLARAGMTAASDIFEAPNGFFDVYGTTASRRGGKVMAEVELGAATRDFPVLRKAWPSCGYTHRAIEAAELLAAELRPEAGRIAGVRVLMPEPYARVAGFLSLIHI